MIPHPLNQEPAPDPIHIIGGTILTVQQLPRVRPTPSRSVNTLAQIRNLHGGHRVGPRVPSVHQRVRRQLSNLVGDHAYHAIHPDVAVWRLHGLQPRHVLRHRERVRAHPGAQLRRVPHPRVRQRVPDDRGEGEVVEPTHLPAEILHVHVGRRQQEVEPALRVYRQRL